MPISITHKKNRSINIQLYTKVNEAQESSSIPASSDPTRCSEPGWTGTHSHHPWKWWCGLVSSSGSWSKSRPRAPWKEHKIRSYIDAMSRATTKTAQQSKKLTWKFPRQPSSLLCQGQAWKGCRSFPLYETVCAHMPCTLRWVAIAWSSPPIVSKQTNIKLLER